MDVWQIIQKLVLGPIELLLDVIYAVTLRSTGSPGWSIIVLSMAVSLFLLPLYKRADTIQKEERERALRMKPRIDQIREAFTGNERFMILQTYYRQNHYKPYYALKSSVSLLLQIPFFMAAYGFLSHLQVLQGVSFGPIRNLGAPDGMLRIFGVTVNLLPVLMTLVNILSGVLYSRNMPLKSKIQMYGLALVFLVLLYNSPSGLVIYWTMNNVFSLVKNALGKIPRRSGAKAGKAAAETAEIRADGKWVFWLSGAFLALLTGLLIPSEVIRSSTAEFLNLHYLQDPMRYLLSSFLLAAGTFVLWCGIYFSMSGKRAKRVLAAVFAAVAVTSVINFMLFGHTYGTITSLMEYGRSVTDTAGQVLLNSLAVLAAAALTVFLFRKVPGLLQAVFATCCVALAVMSAVNMNAIREGYREHEVRGAEMQEEESKNAPAIHLSKNGKNVIVFMADRAIGGYVPFIMNEKRDILEPQFDGFVNYPNVLSFAAKTIAGSPGVYGGYEYIPDNMAKRPDELLVEKHNEALKVMPVLFLQNGFDVTVMDPSLANYQWIPDLSIYDDYPEIHRYNVEGYFSENRAEVEEYKDKIRFRNMFCYSLFRISPLLLHGGVYDGGRYNQTDAGIPTAADEESLIGFDPSYLENYWVMENLDTMTEIREDGDCFLMMALKETHDVTMLQEPDYVPSLHIDNSAYEAEHGIRTDADGNTLDFRSGEYYQLAHYQCDMAAFLHLGRWFQLLQDYGVWDNTRIIIVSDHGFDLEVLGYDLKLDKYPDDPEISRRNIPNDEIWTETMSYIPVLMVKDFDAKGYSTDTTFMTNADTPVLATQGIIPEPVVNPFTGREITTEEKYAEELHLISTNYKVDENNGYMYSDMQVITFRGDDVSNLDNWSIEH